MTPAATVAGRQGATVVRLNRIYTRTGDGGDTGLGDGSRVRKTHPRIEAYGTVDELNAVIGTCVECNGAEGVAERLRRVQNDLFDVGADLCVPGTGEAGDTRLRIAPESVARLEAWIDEINAELQPLKSFVLPGGGPLGTALHLARTVCRRAERRVLALAESGESIHSQTAIYLNRLSDLLFVMARAAAGGDERLWRPGGVGEA